MRAAELGDDVYGEDFTTKTLEERCAHLFGKDAGLFLPSGTMANLVSIMCHCRGRGEEIIVGDANHIVLYEQAGASHIAGVQIRTVTTLPDGTYDMDEVRNVVRPGGTNIDVHYPRTALLCVENTHNMKGGKMRELADSFNLPVHMDGARVLNASVFNGVEPAVTASFADSLCMCFSKNLGCPIGSILVGSSDFIARARRIRKMLGGGMRQTGVLAGAAMYALDHYKEIIGRDHRNALRLAAGLSTKRFSQFLKVDECHSNIVVIDVTSEQITAAEIVARLKNGGADASAGGYGDAQNGPSDPKRARSNDGEVSVLCMAFFGYRIRLVMHRCLLDSDIPKIVHKFDQVLPQAPSSDVITE